MQSKPRVGVGVIVRRGHHVLLGRRKSGHGRESWSFPGGHLELGEQIEDCATREVKEETGALISFVRRGPYTNDIFPAERKHYITLFVVADYVSGEIEAREPDKCERWEWFEWNDLPRPLFLPIQNLLKTGFDPFS
ncbi:MAG: NUDIX hydrolase [Ignavibacteriales bacterium]|nr:NUDIX hydrolase [Ignavibacteriales bacterium]